MGNEVGLGNRINANNLNSQNPAKEQTRGIFLLLFLVIQIYGGQIIDPADSKCFVFPPSQLCPDGGTELLAHSV